MTLECSMLYVNDFARMREFYGAFLQARPINTEWTDTWALFDVGGMGFALHAIPAGHRPGAEIPTPPLNRARSPIKLIFAVEDVAAERARLEEMGISIVQRSWQQPSEACDCIDPEGNIFQIAARIRLPHLLGRLASA